MKKVLFILVFASTLTVVGCREDKSSPGENMDQGTQQTGDEMDQTGDGMDQTGDDMEEPADRTGDDMEGGNDNNNNN